MTTSPDTSPHDPDAHLTPYREIREVPPGQFVRVREGSVSVERYWRFSPRSRIRYKTDAEYEEHFRHVFRQSVRRRLRSDSPVLAELSGGLDSSSIVCMADDILAKEGAQTPRLDTISYYDKTEPNGDDWIYFPEDREEAGRSAFTLMSANYRECSCFTGMPEFCPLPGRLGVGRELGDERADVVRDGGYRAVLSGIGGDEIHGGSSRSSRASGRSHRAVQAHQPGQTAHGLEPGQTDTLDSTPVAVRIRCVACFPGPIFSQGSQSRTLDPEGFAKRTRMAIRQLDVDEHFGLWLPTRRSYIGGVSLMASKLAKAAPPCWPSRRLATLISIRT